LDGTLWDSTNACLLAWSKVMSATTIVTEQISKEQIQSVFGMKHDLIGAKLFPYLNNNQQKQIMENCYAEEINVIKILAVIYMIMLKMF